MTLLTDNVVRCQISAYVFRKTKMGSYLNFSPLRRVPIIELSASFIVLTSLQPLASARVTKSRSKSGYVRTFARLTTSLPADFNPMRQLRNVPPRKPCSHSSLVGNLI